MDFEQIASDIAVRIFQIRDAERKRNTDGDIGQLQQILKSA